MISGGDAVVDDLRKTRRGQSGGLSSTSVDHHAAGLQGEGGVAMLGVVQPDHRHADLARGQGLEQLAQPVGVVGGGRRAGRRPCESARLTDVPGPVPKVRKGREAASPG